MSAFVHSLKITVDLVADPCSYKPCQNGGVCSKISTTAFSCQCKVGFSGDKCDSGEYI